MPDVRSSLPSILTPAPVPEMTQTAFPNGLDAADTRSDDATSDDASTDGGPSPLTATNLRSDAIAISDDAILSDATADDAPAEDGNAESHTNSNIAYFGYRHGHTGASSSRTGHTGNDGGDSTHGCGLVCTDHVCPDGKIELLSHGTASDVMYSATGSRILIPYGCPMCLCVDDPRPAAPGWHLAPAGSNLCHFGVTPSQAQCEAAVLGVTTAAGKTPGRPLQIGSGGGCDVPIGCSVQSDKDWTAHFKTAGNSVDCGGGHSAATCAECSQGNGTAWCGGECEWQDAACGRPSDCTSGVYQLVCSGAPSTRAASTPMVTKTTSPRPPYSSSNRPGAVDTVPDVAPSTAPSTALTFHQGLAIGVAAAGCLLMVLVGGVGVAGKRKASPSGMDVKEQGGHNDAHVKQMAHYETTVAETSFGADDVDVADAPLKKPKRPRSAGPKAATLTKTGVVLPVGINVWVYIESSGA